MYNNHPQSHRTSFMLNPIVIQEDAAQLIDYLQEIKDDEHPGIPDAREHLYISDCTTQQLETIIDLIVAIGAVKNVDTLSLSGNKLRALPDNISKLTHLRSLSLDENELESLPDSICQLSELRSLSANRNRLNRLPENIGELKKLTSINLFINQLEYLPASFTQLVNLTTLYLYSNKLRALPEDFGHLKKLAHLYMDRNPYLRQLPKSFGLLPLNAGLTLPDKILFPTVSCLWPDSSFRLSSSRSDIHRNKLVLRSQLIRYIQVTHAMISFIRSCPMTPDFFLKALNYTGEFDRLFVNVAELQQFHGKVITTFFERNSTRFRRFQADESIASRLHGIYQDDLPSIETCLPEPKVEKPITMVKPVEQASNSSGLIIKTGFLMAAASNIIPQVIPSTFSLKLQFLGNVASAITVAYGCFEWLEKTMKFNPKI